MFKVNIYTKVLPGNTRRTKKYTGYILSCVGKEKEDKEWLGEMEDVTFHEASLKTIIIALERLNQSCEVHIYTEDRFVRNMIEHNLAKWQQDDFKTAKGNPVENEEGWREYWRLSRGQLIRLHKGGHEKIIKLEEKIKNEFHLVNTR